ncbi:MAG: M67 family metallopeptidase [Zoogloeaceae bacterium]|jgi:proteasome lid subunit RPN8/RPN11|nr:M67 family metallopeptidase [Zoogloeaceae bacterium]
MLSLSQSVLDQLIDHARRDAPIEACGYLAGTGDLAQVYFPMRNVDQSAEHFAFDPAEQFAAFRQAQQSGLRLIACCHSHPATPSRPSAEDIRLAYDPNLHYVIVSLADEEPVVNSFRIRQGEVEKEPLEVLP